MDLEIKKRNEVKMDLLYSSTRNSEKKITASQAILKGLADDGGLFVPRAFRHLMFLLRSFLRCHTSR